MAAELDELTRAFADRYVGLLSSTCDALKKDNIDPVQRREAQQLLSSGATNVYDIASNPDAFTRMLDLVGVTTLVSQVRIDDDRAGDVFGDRGEVLVRALHHGRVEAWALASQVLRPDQLDLLDYTMWDWRRHNPDMVRTPFVRFSNFAIGRCKSATAEVLAAGGFFAKVGQAGQAVDEARLLTERMFYMAKREPALLRWEVEALKDDVLATPDVGTYLSDIHRLTAQAEQLPVNVATERQAILTAFDQRMNDTNATLTNLKGVVTDVNALNTNMAETSKSFDAMLKTAGAVFANCDTWSRWSSTQPGRSFDVREYTQGVMVRGDATAIARPSSDGLPLYIPVAGVSGKITSIGESTTTNLVARAATEFRRIYPDVTLQATAGLTSIGPPALLAGAANIVPMSRRMTPEELGAFAKKYGYPPTEIKIAADALAVYVEKRNPLPGLTLEQLDGIFSQMQRRGASSIETWGQAGLMGDWADLPIALYGYGRGDGVNQIFRQQVMEGGDYRVSMRFEPAGSSIVQGVASDPAAIGCASMFFAAKRVRAVPIAGADGLFYAPTAENVRQQKYPLSRFHYSYVNKAPREPLDGPAAEFVRLLLSHEGQQIVAADGNIAPDAATVEPGRRAIE